MEDHEGSRDDKGPARIKAVASAFGIGVLVDLLIILVQFIVSWENPFRFITSTASAAVFALLPILCAISTLAALAVSKSKGFSPSQAHPREPEKVTAEEPHPLSPSPVEEVRRLADIAAREIKHPLTSIVGYSLTLRHYWDKLTEEERREFVDFIHLSSIRLEGMVNDLTRIMELSSGQKKREGEVVDVRETAEEVAQILTEVHRARKVILNLRFPREKLRVKTDPVGLFDLFYNLFDLCMRASSERSMVSVWFAHQNGQVVLRLRCPRAQFHPSRMSLISEWMPEESSDDLATLGMQFRLSCLMIHEMGGHLAMSKLGDSGISLLAQLPAFTSYQ